MKKLVLNSDDIVNVNENDYKIITVTAEITLNEYGELNLSTMLFHLRNISNNQMEYMYEQQIIDGLAKCRNCGDKIKNGTLCDDACMK